MQSLHKEGNWLVRNMTIWENFDMLKKYWDNSG